MGDRRLSANPGTIVYSVANSAGNASPSTDGVRGVVMAGGGILDLSPNSLDAQTLGLGGVGVGASAFDQAQEMDFNAMVAAAENTPAQLTQDQYDAMVKEIKALNDNELLSSDDIRIGTSNILSQNGIVNDQSSLFSGSDAGGLLSKRFVIVDPVDADSGGQETSDLDDASSDSGDLLDSNVDTTVSTDAGAASAESILSSSAETAGTNQSKEGVFSAADAIYQDYLQNPDKYVTGNVLERQLHEAALNETDPALKASLIAEFENYTGEPFDPTNPPMPIGKRVGMGLQRDSDGNLVEGDYVGVYNAASNTFTLPNGMTIKWNGASSVGDDGQMIVPQDGASYSLMGEYDADGNLNTRQGGIEGVVAGPKANDGNQNANADGELTENGLITILNTQGLAGLQGVLIANDISLEDAKTTFPGLAAAVDQLGNTNTGNSNIVSGGGNDTVITGGDGNLTGGGKNGNGDGLNGDGDGLTGTGNTNTGGKFTKTGDAITTYTVVGPGLLNSTVTGNTETLDNVTPDETGGEGTGTSTGIGSGTEAGSVTNNIANTTNIMSNRSINETVFANELERIRLDPTGLLNRLFS